MTQKIKNIGLIPVIKINDLQDALPIAKALDAGGLSAAEITFRTPHAADAIRIIRSQMPDMLVGAGTVLTVEQVDCALDAGAMFVVTPGLNPKVVSYCLQKGISVFPGCSSPTDIEKAIELGIDTVKFFPAEALGGLSMIKALSGPYKANFFPTGGIDENNLVEYLNNKRVVACGGSFMVKDNWVAKKEFDKITETARKAVDKMLGFELSHIGINSENESIAKNTAQTLSRIFSFDVNEIPVSFFVGGFEIMKYPARDKNGHIAIGTNSVSRAMYYLQKRGVEFDLDSVKTDENGKPTFVYLKDDFLGFYIHLTKKQ